MGNNDILELLHEAKREVVRQEHVIGVLALRLVIADVSPSEVQGLIEEARKLEQDA